MAVAEGKVEQSQLFKCYSFLCLHYIYCYPIGQHLSHRWAQVRMAEYYKVNGKDENVWGIKLKLGNLSEWDSNGEMNNLNRDTWARMNLRFCCCFWFILIAKFCISLPSFLYFCKSSLQPVKLPLHCSIFEPYFVLFLPTFSVQLTWNGFVCHSINWNYIYH